MAALDGVIAGLLAIIVPFDGFLALTGAARAEALHEALGRHVGVVHRSRDMLGDSLGARTFAEAARVELQQMAGGTDTVADETLVDIVALDASRAYARGLAHGAMIAPEAMAWVERQSLRSVRMVARADSAREQTQTILTMSGLAGLFTFVRCSDDAPRGGDRSSIEASWNAIDVRLRAASIPVGRRRAIELVHHAADAAAPFVASVHTGTFSE